jgi:ubiquinone/menaquinone biosynthesis C-methylase UbiE
VALALGDRLFAAVYDRCLPDSPRAAQWRRHLLRHAHGVVVEIGAGTGANLPAYPAVERLVLSEPSPAMRRRLAPRAAAAGAELIDAAADRLPFVDGSIDTVVCGLVLCTVPDQAPALAEIRRVLRPGGTLVLFEHVRSDDPAAAAWQDRLDAPWRVVARGCHLNRDTMAAVRTAGFAVTELHPLQLGMPGERYAPHIAAIAVAPG